MKRKQFRIIFALIAGLIGATVGFAVSVGEPLLVLAAVFAGTALIYLCKRKLEDRLEDERILQISRRTSQTVLQFVVLCSALGAAMLIALKNLHPKYAEFGFFLAYASCGLLLLYTLFYMYYNKQYGA
ncbi:MAG: DUF2178 domain-containing protein [Methanosarcinaceae archaeon]|nr:DUF2178 domain-containing protein [Methanosarcinaceae archaeon]